ncbi:DNA repair protein RadA [Thermosipho melanesiensis]|uniref:DNA repair protein RadA n=2 Tax=Thermosipho melanesiensis TaxID=46541 RepID=A6LJ02_THEM4|nr:DNA repair protein RadA [Thermosipho melanesiensis]ABR29903.1 DNA repair protein RadA [Thermosipho melanesiensis BI429]APT73111.1 DNA repair protein RadA [Thermosipho melanesiensis]OOC38510.1 DNA repair protein RadA [Thermosipho melanesiensis]OOC40314.1 DNA repair protein RadA [Thermosipho melanesiensis]OOC40578.1 DNA repair protein RadA [Thermosipho melanesiensis]
MSKAKKIYVCENCGYESPKWFGRCPVCNVWDSARELKFEEKVNAGIDSRIFLLNDDLIGGEVRRIKTNKEEIDGLFGGGIVPGQVILLGGEPGVGKSTLALQISDLISKRGKVLYVSGEESIKQIGIRAKRLGIKNNNLYVSIDNELEAVFVNLKKISPVFVVLDSIQTVFSNKVDGVPGGILQLRTVVEKLRKYSKESGVPILLIAHVNKEGNIAGPKLVEHIVDTVVYFEGEKTTDLRILRVIKNRFGPSGEIAVFQMMNTGLEELKNKVFIEESNMPGNVISCVYEGTRPILVQVQSLVSRDRISTSRRISHGVDVRKLIILSAVISKHLNLPIDAHDIYLNVSGGIKITDPASDLAIASSILSSLFNKFLGKVVVIGEVGLDGSVRKVRDLEKRIENAKKAGFERFIIPHNKKVYGNKIYLVKNIRELQEIIFEEGENEN